jgi:hypothetical protein
VHDVENVPLLRHRNSSPRYNDHIVNDGVKVVIIFKVLSVVVTWHAVAYLVEALRC